MGAAEKIEAPIPNSVQVKAYSTNIEAQTNEFKLIASKLVIKTEEEAIIAADYLKDVKDEYKRIEDERKEITGPLNETVKKINAKAKPLTTALLNAEKIIKDKLAKYHDEQEAKRLKAEAEAEEKARKARERLEARAEAARESGNDEKAEALDYEASTKVAVTPSLSASTPKGVTIKKVWVADVTSIVDLCRAIADGVIMPSCIDVKQAEINKIASMFQDQKDIPGLKIYQKSSVASR